MIRRFKKALYFPIASYFRFWAQIQLSLWKPRIIVITGSSGKTTLLHMIEAQLGERAKYSHLANSSYGIPFDILDLRRQTFTPDEWVKLFFLAPFKAFKPVPTEKIYIVEADCDRPGEGKFLASFLKPEVTLWISSSLTHSLNFDDLVKNGVFKAPEEAIAYEFGYFAQYTKKLIIANGDEPLIINELKRGKAVINLVQKNNFESYKINKFGTEFIIKGIKYLIGHLLPKDVFHSIQMVNELMAYLDIPIEKNYAKFILPPGRSSIFRGIRNTTIIDSTYNATPDGQKNILKMFKDYPAKNKWLILGDMTELGNEEKREHERLADLINDIELEKVILIGPRVSRYTKPKVNKNAHAFEIPSDGKNFILKNVNGGETLLFKGARFLEGIIEELLENKSDINKLVRREKVWDNRRMSFGV